MSMFNWINNMFNIDLSLFFHFYEIVIFIIINVIMNK